MIYLDNSATTAVSEAALAASLRMMTETFGNPSSLHELGDLALDELNLARNRVAKALHCEKDEIFFTPSGTVANNTAIFGAARLANRRGKKIITTAIEHPSVGEPLKFLESQGFEVVRLPVNQEGKINLSDLRSNLDENTILISMMLVNNEIGTINPVKEAAKMIKESGCKAIFHVDAVQAFGKIELRPKNLGVDLLTVSSHKIHGPKGSGALYLRHGLALPPLIMGGGQEKGLISGTEAMPAIAGFGAAVAEIVNLKENLDRITEMRNHFLSKIEENSKILVNSPADALPYIINLSVLGIPSEVLIRFLSEQKIYVSAGSACKKGGRSEVLKNIGLSPNRIDSAIRISLSNSNSEEELDRLYSAINQAIKRFVR